MHWGQALVVLVIAAPFAMRLLGTVRSARGGPRGQSRTGGPASGWFAHRRAVRLENLKHSHASVRDEAKHKQRLEQEAARQERAQARPSPDGSPAGDGERTGRRTVRSRVVRLGDGPAPGPRQEGPAPDPPAPPSSGPSGPSPSSPSSPSSPKPPARESSGPRPDSPAPGPSPQPSGGSTVTVAVPGAEQAVDGINTIAAHARAGNILAKRRAMLALIAVCQRAASMALSLSRALAEPGQHYGPEVTEPIAKGAMHLTAASTAFAEADTSLTTLLRASVAETMESGRQFPHHDELVR